MTIDFNDLKENSDYEFKLAEGQFGQGELPKDFWKTYVAMANTDGGNIILGVREVKEGVFEVNGIKNVEHVKKTLWDTINNKDKVSASILYEADVMEEIVNGKKILIIKIPRAARNKRPIYINNNPKTGTYIRRHEGDYQCTEDEVKRMMTDSDVTHPWDVKTVQGYTLRDLDQNAIQGYKNYLRAKNPTHVFLQSDDLNFLRNIGAVARETDEITHAGLIFFGNHQALTHGLPYFSLDYREISKESNLNDSRWADRVISDGSWAGNIFNFYFKVAPKLVSGLKIPFKLDKDLSRVDDTPTHQSVREALINTLIHADHTGRVGVRIFKYPDRFEFFNFGTFLFPPKEALRGGKSECRNPTIQKIFALIGIGEKAGSGLISILQTWKENQWRKPLLEELFETNETRLELRMISLYPDHLIEGLQHRFGTTFNQLDQTEKLALVVAESEDRLTNRRLQDLSDLHGRDLTYLLKGLVEKGFLSPFEDRQSRYYTVNLGDKAQSLGGKGASLGDKSYLAKVRESKRVRADIMEAAILEICVEEKTIEQIATELGRKDKTTLRKHFISKLVKNGRLELKHPDSINHPHQAYKAK
ncbi:MAG: hypothetical protein A2381_02590 [Bdellovibrionales bacterium RIFOXYB1_FULL_37_110]|nr:MAG: hypothetical protein A2417_06190 [Bdellovibrionales bacterium RIFOXYC1_FULL_37_79]OFZ56323.1 MAG: hypothetical protein A2328_05340 [Bdellovibrionales bacterium RIFOXYB2_FULL_36_6]OFZ57362.1 MAG: hypothetical protein A2381_02590 [Bdellovibrionales bacterium RIFOXYB1_FULL_37_110]